MTDVICSCDACRYISPLGKCTLLGIDIDERGQCMQFEEPYEEDDEEDENGGWQTYRGGLKMNEYISKEDAKNALLNKGQHTTRYRLGETWELNFMEILEALDTIPAADVQPVKHGYWKEEEPRVLKCSVCGEYAPMNYLGQNCIDSRYCPWCGTKMDSNADEPWQSE